MAAYAPPAVDARQDSRGRYILRERGAERTAWLATQDTADLEAMR